MIEYEVATVDGLQYVLNPNITDIVHGAFRNGTVWEPDIVELFQKYVQVGDVVLDIGANMGAHTMQLARLVGPSGVVLAFEPQEHFNTQISYSAQMNGFENRIQVYTNAVGDEITDVPMDAINPTVMGTNSGQAQIFRGTSIAHMITIDSLNLPLVNFMKIDVETYEHLVIQGAIETIKRCRPIITYEYFAHERPPDVVMALVSLGYSISPIKNCPYDWLAIPVDTL
jgi:FkbM family methyltransferase